MPELGAIGMPYNLHLLHEMARWGHVRGLLYFGGRQTHCVRWNLGGKAPWCGQCHALLRLPICAIILTPNRSQRRANQQSNDMTTLIDWFFAWPERVSRDIESLAPLFARFIAAGGRFRRRRFSIGGPPGNALHATSTEVRRVAIASSID